MAPNANLKHTLVVEYSGTLELGSLVFLTVVGCIAGFLNTIAGGGSMLSLPALLFMEIPSSIANGTNRIAIIAQALPASIVFFRRGFTDIIRSAFLSSLLLPGAVLGAYLGVRVDDKVFDKLVAAVLAVTALIMIIKRKSQEKSYWQPTSNTIRRPFLVYSLIFLLGFYGGFIHIGIGFLIMFILHRIGGLDLIQTNTHKVVIVVPYSLVSLFIFWNEVSILWQAGLSLALGNMFGGWVGAHATLKHDGKYIIPFYQATIIIIVGYLIFR